MDRCGIENSCRSSYRLVQVLNACPLVEGHLQRAGVLRNKSFAAVVRLICSRGVVWLTYTMPNVGAWRTLGAYSSFDTMPSRNVVCWTAMILGHVKRGRGWEQLELFKQRQQGGVQPDHAAFCGEC